MLRKRRESGPDGSVRPVRTVDSRPAAAVRVVVGAVLIAVIVVVELTVTVSATWLLARSAGRVTDVDDAPSAPVAIVFGSMVRDGQPLSYVRGRLDTAEQLYRSGRVRHLLMSGNGFSPVGDEVAVMSAYLRAKGIPATSISVDPRGFDTADTCRRARDVYGVERALLVTQDFHTRRAVALCRVAGIDATAVRADCECSTWSLARNHIREALLAAPKAMLTSIG